MRIAAALPDRTVSASAAAGTGFVVGSARAWLRLEALVIFAAALVFYVRSGAGWGRFAALFFVPDLSFAGYLLGPAVGAVSYNVMHSYIGPIVLAAGAASGILPASLLPLGLIWTAHVAADRALGYGLKYPSAFGHTHLGRIGRERA